MKLTPPDLSPCEAEPIHVPGSIQPHGTLLVLHGPTLRIIQAAATCTPLLGIAPVELLERDLAVIFGSELAGAVHVALGHYLERPTRLAPFSWRSPASATAFSGYVHQTDDGLTVLELEPADPADQDIAGFLAEALAGFDAIRAQSELRTKAQTATALFRGLTGYDRVMIYQFSPDWDGEVIAESRRADLTPYLGLHYPASDIPAQARRLYLINRAPIIADVNYQPALLIPALNPVTGRALDLSRSLLRSVAPVHRHYLRNMGVRATLAASLIQNGELWGLLACHHEQPRTVSRAMRELVDWMAQDLAGQLALVEEQRSRRYVAHLKDCREQALNAVRQEGSLEALLTGPEQAGARNAFGAEGIALVRGAEVLTNGATPDHAAIRTIISDLKVLPGHDPQSTFVTDCLSQHLPWTADLAATAAGLIRIPLETRSATMLLGFRGEHLRQLTWGGNPDQALDQTPDGRLSPRRSFAAWAQTVRWHSLRWTDEELQSVHDLATLLDNEVRRNRERELRVLRQSIAHLNDIVLITEAEPTMMPGPRIVFVNEAFERQTGYTGAEVIGQTPRLLQGPLTDRAELDRVGAALLAWQPVHAELLNYRKDGSPYWVELDIVPVADHSGWFTHWISIQRDITGRRQAESALQDSEVRYQQLVAQLDEGVIVVDAEGRIASANDSACRILGRSVASLEGFDGADPVWRLFDADDQPVPPEQHPINLTLQTGMPQQNVVFTMRLGVETRWIAFTTKLMETTQVATPRAVLASFRDVTERRQLEAKLTRLAQLDTLTGLPNRVSFQDHFAQALAGAAQSSLLLGVMLVDLDHFKDVNDSLGHAVGDKLLCAVAQRLVDSLRSEDMIARLGGDEFAICTMPSARLELIGLVGGRIAQALHESFTIDGHEISTSGSVGIAVFPSDGRDTESLLRHADIAMYAAKRDRFTGFRFYSPELESQAAGHLAARTRLQRAIELGQLELHYQPQVTIADQRLVGLEALVRWRTEDGKLVSPLDFIPIAEETGLIVPLGDWILRRACADCQTLTRAGLGEVIVAINLSGRQFRREQLAKEIAAIIAEAGIAPARIELEMTESVTMQGDALKLNLRLLRELKELGCWIAIDDFGTGYSSLAYLCRFPVDTLKIDRAFVHGLATNHEQLLITKAIISLGHALELKTLAEGVETEEELALLKKLGCDEYQGYLYSRPKPLPELIEAFGSRARN
jgi:diguanylate cyclase (GGDEF)-like protein/PAS domain S-box-containing protein